MKRIFVLILLLAMCVSIASADRADMMEKINRYFFRVGIVIKNDRDDYATCIDCTGKKWKISHGQEWRIGEICSLWLYTNKRETGIYWAQHGGYTNLKKWDLDEIRAEESFFDLITEEDYRPVDYYSITAVVTSENTCVDWNGKEWQFVSEYSYQVDDIIACWIWNKGTEKLKDDIIISVTYCGHAENFFKSW